MKSLVLSTVLAFTLTSAAHATQLSLDPTEKNVTYIGDILCTDDNGQQLILKETNSDRYYNGEMIIIGNDIVAYFSGLNFLKSKDASCVTDKKGLTSCTLSARVSVKDLSASHNGEYEDNYVVKPDFGGAKLLVYFGSHGDTMYYNWWFKTCLDSSNHI